MLLMIDNYDSFTYNLVQYLGELGEEVKVVRNDEITLDEIEQLAPERIVISPGPCTPNGSGHLGAAHRALRRRDSRSWACASGTRRSGRPSAGASCTRRSSCTARPPPSITTAAACSAGCPTRYTATRYHSLAIERASLPDCLEVSAWTDDGEIMGVRHKTLAVEGVQFHPESILTEHGHALLKNFLEERRHDAAGSADARHRAPRDLPRGDALAHAQHHERRGARRR